jgi:hypothetical protein
VEGHQRDPDAPPQAVDSREYEERLAEAVQAALPQRSDMPVAGRRGQSVIFDNVVIEGTYPESMLVFYLRDLGRPRCQFGYK